jgi:hypothetical protein
MRKFLTILALIAIIGTLLYFCLSLCSVQQPSGCEWCMQPDTASGEKHTWKIRSCDCCKSVQRIETLLPPFQCSIDLSRIVGNMSFGVRAHLALTPQNF